MKQAKFKKLKQKARFGGNVYEYRGFKIEDVTSPNNPYGEWLSRGEYKGTRIWESANTRKMLVYNLDRALAKIEAQA